MNAVLGFVKTVGAFAWNNKKEAAVIAAAYPFVKKGVNEVVGDISDVCSTTYNKMKSLLPKKTEKTEKTEKKKAS